MSMITWKQVLNPSEDKHWTIEAACDLAKRAGYKYIAWNGNIVHSSRNEFILCSEEELPFDEPDWKEAEAAHIALTMYNSENADITVMIQSMDDAFDKLFHLKNKGNDHPASVLLIHKLAKISTGINLLQESQLNSAISRCSTLAKVIER